MQLKKVLCILLILFFSIPVRAAFDWHDDFESYTLDQSPYDTCSANEEWYNASGTPNTYCDDEVEDTYTDRSTSAGTGKYWRLWCEYGADTDQTDTDINTSPSHRVSKVACMDSSWSPVNAMNFNDDTEYWIGFSYYIPADAYQEYCRDMIMQITQAPSNTKILNTYWGGGYEDDADSGCCTSPPCAGGTNVTFSYFSAHIRHDGTGTNPNMQYNEGEHSIRPFESSGGLLGTWVDFVLHFVWHDSDDADAVSEMWLNGEEIFSLSGKNNLSAAGEEPILNIPLSYNPNSLYQPDPPGSHWNRWYSENGGSATKADWRQTIMDEWRMTEDTIGNKNYCDVVPPIWAAKPTGAYPSEGATDISTTFTATYSAYNDHRTDEQSCFGASKMEIEVDVKDGGFDPPIYDSGEVSYSATGHEVSGLSDGITYEWRVRFSSTARSTDYWGEWSDLVEFSTGEDLDHSSVTIGKK